MVSIEWCYKQKQGIKLIEVNENTARSYLEMADDSLEVMNNEKNKSLRWAISSCYYSMYYSFYAVLQKAGIKCEIHSCALKLLEVVFMDFYSEQDLKLIRKAFDLRISAQYYIDRVVDKEDAEYIFSNAEDFVTKSKEVISRLNEEDIKKIRQNLNNNL